MTPLCGSAKDADISTTVGRKACACDNSSYLVFHATEVGFITAYQYCTTLSLEAFILVHNTDIKKGNRIRVYRKETCGMIWNKKVEPETIRHP
jgi:hypothetical protein